MQNKRIISGTIIILLFTVSSCIGWGDMFAKEQKVVGAYRLAETEDGYYKLYYNNIGRSPQWMNIIEYGILDSLLICVAQANDSSKKIIGINMSKDNEYAKDENYYLSNDLAVFSYSKLRQKSMIIKVKLPHSN